MTIGAETSALGSLTESNADTPKKAGEQVEYLFAQQFLSALSQQEGQGGEDNESASYLSLLSDSLAREIASSQMLGIGKQLMGEVQS